MDKSKDHNAVKPMWWAVLRLRSATAHPTKDFQDSRNFKLKIESIQYGMTLACQS
jgi:hypothetical protein